MLGCRLTCGRSRPRQPDERSGGHLDELPLGRDRLVGEAVNVAIGSVADVDRPDIRLRRQAAVAGPLEDMADLLGKFSSRGELTAPVSRLLVPTQYEEGLGRIHKQRLQGCLYCSSFVVRKST